MGSQAATAFAVRAHRPCLFRQRSKERRAERRFAVDEDVRRSKSKESAGNRTSVWRIAGGEVTAMSAAENRFALALGQAVIGCWGNLPQDIQQLLFEKAVVAGH